MPTLLICTVRDAAIDAYGQPIFVRHTGEACRSFADECNREGSTFNKHPEDYELFFIGTYDDDRGLITPQNPSSLLTGKAAYREPKKD